ncbi:hypothetical protein [Ralstonia solanacearum]|nr:hypothetical protein [Ralstonia solanacearum]
MIDHAVWNATHARLIVQLASAGLGRLWLFVQKRPARAVTPDRR